MYQWNLAEILKIVLFFFLQQSKHCQYWGELTSKYIWKPCEYQSFQTGSLFKKQFLSKVQLELFLLLWIIQKTSLKNMTCFTSFKHIIQEKIFLFIWPYGRCCTSPVHMPWYWYSKWHINGVTSFTTND